jgi:spermidine synthase
VTAGEVRLRTVVALSGAVLMSLEILGSRVLAPTFGSSVYVWASLITVFLAALAAGYAFGGRLADHSPRPGTLSLILSAAALLILPSVRWAPAMLEALARSEWDVRWAALLASTILFLPPSIALGMVSPFAVRLAVRHLERVGAVAGYYSALSTAGSIVGTLLTAFVLIPVFPVHGLLLILSLTLVACALLLARGRAPVIAALLAAIIGGLAFSLRAAPGEEDAVRTLLSRDTAYHHITVSERDGIRSLRFDNLVQGGVFLDAPDTPYTAYEQGLFMAWGVRPGIRRVCQIGLGTGSFPRTVARLVPEASVTTVEIDPIVREVARDFFRYRETPRARTVIADGRLFLARGGESYDLIVLDAFNSTGTPFHLTTREFFQTVRRRLTGDGVFVANFIGGLMGRDARLFWASYRTIRQQFGQVYLMSREIARGDFAFQGNLILLATVSADPISVTDFTRRGRELGLRWELPVLADFAEAVTHSPEPMPGIPELTDAYAPVEALQNF